MPDYSWPSGPSTLPGGSSGQFKPDVPAIFTPQPASPKLPGWGEQLGQFFSGLTRFAGGVGNVIAAFKGAPMMAGSQMMDQFGMDGSGSKTPEDNVANLENVLKILQQYGVIGSKTSEPKMPSASLDVGSENLRIS